jgi:hypothetical protein
VTLHLSQDVFSVLVTNDVIIYPIVHPGVLDDAGHWVSQGLHHESSDHLTQTKRDKDYDGESGKGGKQNDEQKDNAADRKAG